MKIKAVPAMICGLPISSDSHEMVLAEIDRVIRTGESGHYISITNTESMYHGLRIPEHGRYIREADFSLCDGVGVILAGYFWGQKIRRYNGPILQLDCSDYGQDRGWRHFYYGGKEGVAEEMARRLKERYPRLEVVGVYCPPFGPMTPEHDAEVVRIINEARPDIVWVGLGLLKQEAWIAQHLGRIVVPWMVGVGAAFDYHSGAVPWAPKILQRFGLEWLYRLIVQPRLRAKRYWWSLKFLVQGAVMGVLRTAPHRKQ